MQKLSKNHNFDNELEAHVTSTLQNYKANS